MSLRTWISAARPRTLMLSVSGILMGSSLAYHDYRFRWDIFSLALLTAITLQILSNFANDYGDGIKGTDAYRVGPKRVIQSGDIIPKHMRCAMISTGVVASLSAVVLIYVAFGTEWQYVVFFFLLTVVALIAAIKYTIGKTAYGYRGLGDIFVFVFFGLVSVIGTYFLYTKTWSWKLLLPASALGLLSVGVLNVNNMRDHDTDRATGKRTLVVLMGSEDVAKLYHYNIILVAMICMMGFSVLSLHSWGKLFYMLIFIPLIAHMLRIKKTLTPEKWNSELRTLALLTFLVSLLFSLGYFLGL